MKHSAYSADAIQSFLESLAVSAGREIAHTHVIEGWSAGTDTLDIGFMLTDIRGTIFSGHIPGDWRHLNADELKQEIIAKYPLAFTPDDKEKIKTKIVGAVNDALHALKAARIAVMVLRGATK